MNKAQEIRKITFEQYKLSSVNDVYNMLTKRIENEAEKGSFRLTHFFTELDKEHSKELGKEKYYTYTISSCYDKVNNRWTISNHIVTGKTIKEVMDLLRKDGFSIKSEQNCQYIITW